MASQRLDLAVRTLRRRWKPHKLRLSGGSQEQQNTAIRFHRACSWLGHVQSKEDAEKDDLSLVSLSMLTKHRRFVLTLLADEFLRGFFRQDPSET